MPEFWGCWVGERREILPSSQGKAAELKGIVSSLFPETSSWGKLLQEKHTIICQNCVLTVLHLKLFDKHQFPDQKPPSSCFQTSHSYQAAHTLCGTMCRFPSPAMFGEPAQ